MEFWSAPNKDERLAFAYKHMNLDWSNVLFAKFDIVRCVNVWVALTEFGPFHVSSSDGQLNSSRYVQILNDIVLPFLVKNPNMIYVQVRSCNTFVI